MQVLISKQVHLVIEEFYDIALQLHPALDKITQLGSWIYTWSKDGKKISTRYKQNNNN